MRICTRCNQAKPKNLEFAIQKSRVSDCWWYSSWCYECYRQYNRQWKKKRKKQQQGLDS